MTNRGCQRIGGISWRRFIEAEQGLDHVLHLAFLGVTTTDDGLFDLGRRILLNVEPGLPCAQHRHPARVPELQRRIRISVHKDFLNCSFLGLMRTNHVSETVKEGQEPVAKFVTAKLQAPMINVVHSMLLNRDQTVTCNARAGVNAKDDGQNVIVTIQPLSPLRISSEIPALE